MFRMNHHTGSDDRTLTGTGGERPSDIPSQAPGTILLDDYEVVQHLGRGGMGSVYLVQSRSTGREYAVKRILPELVRDPGHRRSFLAGMRRG